MDSSSELTCCCEGGGSARLHPLPIKYMPSWFEEGNNPMPFDDEQRLLQKRNSQIYDIVGNRSSEFPEGCAPLSTDDEERSTKKINILLQ